MSIGWKVDASHRMWDSMHGLYDVSMRCDGKYFRKYEYGDEFDHTCVSCIHIVNDILYAYCMKLQFVFSLMFF